MLDSATLLQPAGPIDPKLFPGEGRKALGIRLEAYVDRAYLEPRVADMDVDTEDNVALQDRAARAYALYLAFMDVYTRMLTEPVTVAIAEKGSHGYTMAQINAMKALADGYLVEFEGLVPFEPDVAPPTVGTLTVRTFPSF